MDTKTLQGLMTAFNLAPSSELAKIIVLELIKNNSYAEIGKYAEHITPPVEADEVAIICATLYEHNLAHLALPLLKAIPDERESILLAKCLVQLGRIDEGKAIYIQAVKKDAFLENTELNKTLSINRALDFGFEDTKPKLRVIEKNNPDEIINLDRYREKTTNFSDVVGLHEIKKQINKKIIMPFQKPSIFEKFKKKIGGGVLIYGPPGCGKTLLARATAGECQASFFNIEISDVLDMYIGESEQKLHAIFQKARNEKPSVIFFDEIEALAGKREHSRNSTTANIVSQFLTELDGFSQNNSGILVLASTNVPWAVDTAFLRPGRFDRMIFIPPPDKEARQAILEHHMKGRLGDNSIDLKIIASKTSGYSGADLYNLIEMAADEAIDQSIETGTDKPISQNHFKLALEQSRATTTEWLTTARNYARYANDGGRYNDVVEFLKKHGG